MNFYNVHQALNILQNYYITDSIQMVTRWIREGKIRAERSENRKDGWRIHHEDLFEFIEEQRPGMPEIMAVHDWYVKNAFRIDSDIPIEKEVEMTTEEVRSKDLPQEKVNEWELEKLQLENQIINLSNQLLHANQRIYDLTNELEIVREDYCFLEELYEQVEEMRKELAGQNALMNQQVTSSNNNAIIKSKPNRESSNKTLSYKDFTSLFSDVSKEFSSKVGDYGKKNDVFIKDIYSVFFSETECLEDNIVEMDEYRCPITDKPYRNLKSMLKNAIRVKLKEVVVNEDDKVEAGNLD
ncbi:DNA-binding protein [Bacillus sp. M6-12]|uniref:helix-turn-helix domain-containing protein n=1 Tax=Bacillus sp. M6-12 TaxID=2054166 RepID=UPI000C77EC25|nr:helix-turn-helix domain-containing protein [Bacillus sp. M6-12]PLS17623.1 DNA-binding protein [Bacillus sp. M6-12]